jgi:SAM-dependent methyltransferase
MAAASPPLKRQKTLLPEKWSIYPPKRQFSFKTGDFLVVKPTDSKRLAVRGRVVRVENDALQVRMSEQEELSFGRKQRKRLLPLFGGGVDASVVLTRETNYFRNLVLQVDSKDAVLEIGCSTGETSRLLIAVAKSWVGFDTSEEMIDQCKVHLLSKEKEDCCHATKIDALVDPKRALEVSKTFGEPNVVFVDIGGNRECINVLRMLSWVLKSYTLRLVVVKSRELVQLIQTSANSVDLETGAIQNGYKWFCQHQKRHALPKHPVRAPLVLSPKDGKTPICRYHNYHKNGCSKKDNTCPLDHEHCHACQQVGHIARACPTLVPETDGESI